jgi:hypothetical protein
MNRPQEFQCTRCGSTWIGSSQCPNGCDGFKKSNGEFTKKTLQGEDTDLRKSGR